MARRTRGHLLAEQVLTVVKPHARLARLKGIDEPYCERLGHARSDLGTVEPGYFGSLCGRLRDAPCAAFGQHVPQPCGDGGQEQVGDRAPVRMRPDAQVFQRLPQDQELPTGTDRPGQQGGRRVPACR